MVTDLQKESESTVFNYPLILIFVTIILFIGLVFRYNDLSLLSGLVLFLMAGSKVWSLLSLSNVHCAVHLDKERVFPGETVTLTMNVDNAKLLPVWVSLQWKGNGIPGMIDENSSTLQESNLLWYQRARFQRNIKALRRGLYQVAPSHICTSDFFGFFKSKKKLNEIEHLIVYPKLVQLKVIDLPKHDLFGTPSEQSPVKDPVYIMGINDYQPSTPSRHIHWKASAKYLRTKEKLFEPSMRGKIMVALDVVEFEKEQALEPFEYTLEVIASLTLQWMNTKLAVGFMTNGTALGGDLPVVPTNRNPKQISNILEILARLQIRQPKESSNILSLEHGPLQGVHLAYFCYQNGSKSEEMIKICRKRKLPITVFTWRLNPSSTPKHKPAAAKTHMIEDVRWHEVTQS